jgi:hypothetical protein
MVAASGYGHFRAPSGLVQRSLQHRHKDVHLESFKTMRIIFECSGFRLWGSADSVPPVVA